MIAMLAVPGVLSGRELVDKICARVNGVPIFFSQLNQAQISKEGGFYTLDELIEEEVFYQKAVERKLTPNELEVDKNIVAYKRDNDLIGKSDKEADAYLESQIGITFADYKNQLMRYLSGQNYRAIELNQRASVTAEEVEAYHAAHPDITEPEYWIKMATVKKDDVSILGKLKQDINQLAWEDLEWMKRSEISPGLISVTHKDPGEVTDPIKQGESYIVLKLVDKKNARTRSLSDRYIEIEKKLHAKKRESFTGDLRKELYSEAVIQRF